MFCTCMPQLKHLDFQNQIVSQNVFKKEKLNLFVTNPNDGIIDIKLNQNVSLSSLWLN